jgi:hypothetical protein
MLNWLKVLNVASTKNTTIFSLNLPFASQIFRLVMPTHVL